MDRLKLFRRLTQIGFAALILLLPVFDIFRYDTATKELFIFGSVWSLGLDEAFYLDRSLGGAGHVALQFFLNAILPWIVVLGIFPLLGTLFGRFFCGWFCPEGALFELADFLTLGTLGRTSLFGKSQGATTGRPVAYGVAGGLIMVFLPPVVGLFLAGYFIAPATIWQQVSSFSFSMGVKAAVVGTYIYMFVTFVLVRHYFCKYVCAPGLMQMLFGWVSPASLRIRFEKTGASRCTDCGACERVCFMGVKPRLPRRDINCVNCGECISACHRELDGKGLFSFGFGAGKRASVVENAPAETPGLPVGISPAPAINPDTDPVAEVRPSLPELDEPSRPTCESCPASPQHPETRVPCGSP